MNIDNIIKLIKEVSAEKYPEEPFVSDLCEKILKWERDNISYFKPHYKEPYKKYLNECLKNEET